MSSIERFCTIYGPQLAFSGYLLMSALMCAPMALWLGWF